MKVLAFIERLYIRYYLYWAWRVDLQRAIIVAVLFGSALCRAENTNKVAKAEKEKQVEHQANKIIVKSRDKGSNGPWKAEREFPLMFSNNRKAKKPKAK